MNRGTAFLFEWLQMVTDRISAEYYDEAERLARADPGPGLPRYSTR